MGNVCSVKEKPLLNIENDNELKQIMIHSFGDCTICESKNVEGTEVIQIIEDKKLFICNICAEKA